MLPKIAITLYPDKLSNNGYVTTATIHANAIKNEFKNNVVWYDGFISVFHLTEHEVLLGMIKGTFKFVTSSAHQLKEYNDDCLKMHCMMEFGNINSPSTINYHKKYLTNLGRELYKIDN